MKSYTNPQAWEVAIARPYETEGQYNQKNSEPNEHWTNKEKNI